ncbi:MAG: PepSY domain-containing protein, partial [Pseudonocardiaceae bacterium]
MALPACRRGSPSPMSPTPRSRRGCSQAMTSCYRSTRRTPRARWSTAATSWRTPGQAGSTPTKRFTSTSSPARKLAQSDSSSSGAIGQATSFGVYIHMGTEFGVIDRIIMTTGALLLLVSIGTSLVRWWIRRPH